MYKYSKKIKNFTTQQGPTSCLHNKFPQFFCSQCKLTLWELWVKLQARGWRKSSLSASCVSLVRYCGKKAGHSTIVG